MRFYDPDFAASLASAREGGIAPATFVHFAARNRETGDVVPLSVWSGDEDLTLTLQAADGSLVSRTYVGGCGLRVEGMIYGADLTDRPVSVSLSQIAPFAQSLARGHDLRLAQCEIHATTWTRGALTSAPQIEWIGIVDDGPIATPAAGSEGAISITVRSELMAQLLAINPAKSSDEHQRRRSPTDGFSKYAAAIRTRSVQWYKE
ncbi:hypothetical protein [Falsigemmobacter faecalis]|uniref:DUF2163 domain-containing protein n=1 Tax=Falsigemmobacter faecalis TaxID=2488730 RepID=A0A3P3DCB7_9RHOB|nr:hypothetical protein [Falsigemmobacter faecalis]RRH71266.1 hypothetical protein EG244_16450 [Falsigemmobacter faecalis]